jgi:hypothetical protein
MHEEPSPIVRRALPAPAAEAVVQYASLGVAAGLPLDEVFLALAEDADDRRLRAAAGRIAAALHDGATLPAALATVAGQLPPYLERALATSSDAGHTAAMLAGLTRHEAARRRLMRKVRAALFYPAIVLIVFVLVFAGLGLFVLPEVEATFVDLDMLDEYYYAPTGSRPGLPGTIFGAGRIAPYRSLAPRQHPAGRSAVDNAGPARVRDSFGRARRTARAAGRGAGLHRGVAARPESRAVDADCRREVP